VVLDRDNRVISTGFNGAPPGERGCLEGACPRGRLTYDQLAEFSDYEGGPGRCMATHAEVNALLFAGQSCRGATMYITDLPCMGCAKVLVAAGIERVVVGEPSGPQVFGSADLRELRDGVV
jgi:dCMP deaminase